MSDLIFGAVSVYGVQTHKGFVEVALGDEKHQIMPSKAREIAGFLLEAAAAAEGDEVLMATLDRAGLSQRRAVQILLAMRQERTVIQRRAREEG